MLSVAQILAEPELNLRQVNTADTSLGVSWVATSELTDPAAFFKGGEVLLTTGLQTSGWTDEWMPYVESLAATGIVAIGIGTGLTYAAPPVALVDACRHCGMNLFEVPRTTPFVAISHRVSRLLANDEEEDARTALRSQRALISAAIKPDAPTQLVAAIARAVGAACQLTPDGRIAIGPIGDRRSELVPDLLRDEVQRMRKTKGQSASVLSGPTGTVAIQPLRVSQRRASYLAVAGPARLTDGQRTSITAAVSLLSLIGEQQRQAAATTARLRTRALELVVTGHADTAELVLATDPGCPMVSAQTVVLRAAGAAADFDEALEALHGGDLLAAEYCDELCVLTSPGTVREVASEIARVGLRIGIGIQAEPSQAAESYRTAGLALSQAGAGAIVEWKQIVHHGPLALIDRGAAEAFALSLIGELSEEQRDLLRSFLIYHGSIHKVAQELGVHRNTVRNKVVSIEAGLRGSLNDPQVRVSAWIALQSLASAELPRPR